MKAIKYSLPFINGGKGFVVPNWSVEKHEKAIANTIEYTKDKKDLSETQKENELKYHMIYETLLEIDKTVDVKDIREYFTHPENLVEFFTAVYNAGKKDIHFHQGGKTPKKRNST